jgi:uncharacterized protein (TIGR02246 family)
MPPHPVKALIEVADAAISRESFDVLMDFYADDATLVVRPGLHARGKEQIRAAFEAIAGHFDHSLSVRQGEMVVVEGADIALVLMETLLNFCRGGKAETVARKATYVFRKCEEGDWSCVIDNSYGTDLIAMPRAA